MLVEIGKFALKHQVEMFKVVVQKSRASLVNLYIMVSNNSSSTCKQPQDTV